MKIRPRIPIFEDGGVSGVGRTSNNWYNDIHQHQMQTILNRLQEYGEADDYMQWLNAMQHAHSYIWNNNKDKINRPQFDPIVQHYQRAYSGDNTYYPLVEPMNPDSRRWQLKEGTNDDYNQYGIKSSFENGIFTYPGKRTSKDNPKFGYNPDGYFSGITDYRRLLGRKGDYSDEQLNNFRAELNKRGYDIYEDTNDNGYYKLKRLIKDPDITDRVNPIIKKEGDITEGEEQEEEGAGVDVGVDDGTGNKFDWDKVRQGFSQIMPDLLEGLRLTGSLYNNNRIYDAKLKGIRPNLIQTYNTHRQVVGDEATKQAYYRRAIQGQTKASKPFTSDADRQMAYQFEAKRVGDELRAQGDLADNAEIRRTSDESNQHQWDNTRRATEVANQNTAQINAAHAARQDLIAQKYAANWTSWDNFLKSKEYRIRQNQDRNRQLLDQLWALDSQTEIATDEKYIKLKKEADDAWNDENLSAEEKQKKIKAFTDYQRELQKRLLRKRLTSQSYIGFGKTGIKITRKRKDDLLYKSTRDVVEHFRKMSKMSDDSTQRSRKNYFKLSTHPGYGSTRRMQQGGIAPFTVFTPVAIGGETSTQVSNTGGSSKESKFDSAKETLDLVKALFREVNGLPVDVENVYKSMSNFLAKAKAFGNELDTNDIASMYLKSMQQLSNVKHSKELFEKAKSYATQNESLGELAVTAMGHYVVQDKEGNLSETKSLEEAMNQGKTPVTNQQLLYLRAYSPNMAFFKGDSVLENIISNGMGINKIGARIKELAGSIGTSEQKLDGVSQVESNKIKKGLEILANAPEGYYKITSENKTQRAQVQAALAYIENMLSPSQKAILDVHGGTRKLIASFLSSQTSNTNNLTVQPLTGKAATDSNGNSKGGGNSENSAGLAFVLGQGPRELISFNTGTSNEIEVLGIKGVLQTKSNENLGQGSTLQDATKSQQGGYLQWNKATFGGSKLNSSAYNHIILNDSTIMGMDLPYTKDINGNEVPDFQRLRKMEQADEDIRKNNITGISQINQIYIKYGLDPKYTPDGKLNQLKYKRFAAIQVTLDEQSLQNKEAVLSDEVALAGEVERDLYKEIMKKSNKDYDLDDGIFGYFRDNLYKGTIFIPYSEDIAFAALSSGQPFNQDLPNNVTTIQEKQYAPKISQYVSPQVTLSQIKNN